MNSIYLDNNATTPLRPEVAAAMAECHAAGYANAASAHAAGQRARAVLEDAREGIARMLGIDLTRSNGDRLIFTSGGTEANNLAVFGLAGDHVGHAIVSAIEHPSVVGPAEQLAQHGWRLDRLGVTKQGVARVEELEDLLRADTALVSLMLGNNETGVIQPVGQAARLCAARGVPLHTDAVQAVGKIAVDFAALGASAMSFSAHKFHGPVGIGALAVRRGVPLVPQLHGGFQQEALRPGTEPVALVVGFHAALDCWSGERSVIEGRTTALREQFEGALLAAHPELVVNGAGAALASHFQRGVSGRQPTSDAHGAGPVWRVLLDRFGVRQRLERPLADIGRDGLRKGDLRGLVAFQLWGFHRGCRRGRGSPPYLACL